MSIVDGLWLLLLSAYVLAGAALVPFHGDESTLIYMGRDYHQQVVQGDIDAVRYYDLIGSTQAVLAQPDAAHLLALLRTYDKRLTDQDLRLLNGTLPKYVYGWVSASMGYTAQTLNEQWLWGAGWDYNVSAGHMPDEALLQRSRLASAMMLAAGVWVLFALGRAIGGRGTAYLATLYLALSPALLLNGRRAMMESAPLLFGLLVVLVSVLLLKSNLHRGGVSPNQQSARGRVMTRPYETALYVALGILSGLAVASKHTAFITVAAVFFALGSLYAWQGIRQGWRHLNGLLGLLLAGVLSLMVFYALNPAWWGDPLARVGDLLARRADLLAGQVAAFGGYTGFADQIAGFARQVLIAQPMYSEADFFLAYISDQIAAYEASPWSGVALGGSVIGGLLFAVLCAYGCLRLLLDERLSAGVRWLLGVWIAAVLCFTLLLTPLEWQRYYLPAFPVVGLLAAYGLSHATYGLLSWRKNQRTTTHPKANTTTS